MTKKAYHESYTASHPLLVKLNCSSTKSLWHPLRQVNMKNVPSLLGKDWVSVWERTAVLFSSWELPQCRPFTPCCAVLCREPTQPWPHDSTLKSVSMWRKAALCLFAPSIFLFGHHSAPRDSHSLRNSLFLLRSFLLFPMEKLLFPTYCQLHVTEKDVGQHWVQCRVRVRGIFTHVHTHTCTHGHSKKCTSTRPLRHTQIYSHTCTNK